MDLTSLITTIVTSLAALVAIIGGLLVSRVISLANDQHFIKRQIDEISLNITHKKEILDNIINYLFEDDLDDFVTLDSLVLLINNYSLEDIMKKEDYYYLTKEELEPYFKILLDIKNEVETRFEHDNFSKESFEEFIKEKKMKYPDRSNWYELMLEAIAESISPSHFRHISPYAPNPNLHNEYHHKNREKEQLTYEIMILERQKSELKNSRKYYIQTRGIWLGIIVLILTSVMGILYPATLLPYPIDYYNDGETRLLLLILLACSLILIFGYLIFSVYKITFEEDK